jgi:hypothetical protein
MLSRCCLDRQETVSNRGIRVGGAGMERRGGEGREEERRGAEEKKGG